MARIGIFGGTFDPIHIGHLMCAEQARDACALDTVIFVPVSIPAATKIDPVLETDDRMNMCKLAIADNPAFDISDVDIVRGGITYTADTLTDLREAYPDDELFFITGSDSAKSLPKWYKPKTLARLASFIAVDRPGAEMTDDEVAELKDQGFSVIPIRAARVDVSSTEIRRLVAEGRSIRYLCPYSVCAYIQKKGLYQKGIR
ncbi:MAG: nicotinate-nucleotide adenylyltransferase [Eggerthellaceae bacterium]|nr:nicotinate-nucleotide adenylyltransferase [Eggerthellaceae bacterium]